MSRIDRSTAPAGSGTRYPAEHAAPCRQRQWLRLGDAAALTQFGVNELTLQPGAWSSQRHWHSHEDEFVYVLRGSVVLVTDAGEETLGPGCAVGFPAGVEDGHCLQNRSAEPAVLLVVGSRHDADAVTYPDIDLHLGAGRYRDEVRFAHKDGSPY
jgi:uncharacterized cupin superfamily protein